MVSDSDQHQRLEALSAHHPNWVLRCRGHLASGEPFELILFRGFSSSTSHSTTVDADGSLLQAGDQLETIEILKAPLQPDGEQILQPARAPEAFWQALSGNSPWATH